MGPSARAAPPCHGGLEASTCLLSCSPALWLPSAGDSLLFACNRESSSVGSRQRGCKCRDRSFPRPQANPGTEEAFKSLPSIRSGPPVTPACGSPASGPVCGAEGGSSAAPEPMGRQAELRELAQVLGRMRPSPPCPSPGSTRLMCTYGPTRSPSPDTVPSPCLPARPPPWKQAPLLSSWGFSVCCSSLEGH